MTRELKFRAWDALSESMFGVNDTPQEFWSNVHPSSCDVHVMQFTGLKDSEGNNIYEGDIVKSVTDGDYNPMITGVVVFDDESLTYEVYYTSKGNQNYAKDLIDVLWRIIGNKFENKELPND